MSYGEIWWLHGDTPTAFDDAMTALDNAGLSRAHPTSGAATVISDEGDQLPWDPAEVRSTWLSGRTVTAQLWLTDEVDVLVSAERARGLLSIDLTGMTPAEARRTVFATLNAALSQPGTIAVVVDRNLPDRGDEVLASFAAEVAGPPLAFVPDLMLTPTGDAQYALGVRPQSWLGPGPPA